MSEETRGPFWTRCVGTNPRDRRNQRRLLVASLAWAVAFVGASWVIEDELVDGPLVWAIAAAPALLGLGVIVTYSRFLRETTDELQRLIQLEALALGFGGGLFAIYGYSTFQELGAPAIDLVDSTLIMISLYVLGIVLGLRRYR